jgi:hypothetical protein
MATARLWNAGFSIKHARDSWDTIRPALVDLCNKYYLASQEAGKVYYNACRISAGLGTLPDYVDVKLPVLDAHHLGRVIDPCGLGAFLHEVKQGQMMVDAFNSARKTLSAAVATLIMSGARDYIVAASNADPASKGVRRVTKGTCGYCESLADMGAKVPDGGWHADCDCTSEPTFGDDTGPSQSSGHLDDDGSIDDDGGSIGIDENTWNNTVEYVGNSLKSGNLKDAQEFLNPDGSLNESKAITHLIAQHKNHEPYSLSESGKPLNKTQTKLLDKFFDKLTNGKVKLKPKIKADDGKYNDMAAVKDLEGDDGSDLKALSAAELKQLDSGIQAWKTGNSAKRQQIQQQILQFLTGKSNLPKSIQAIGRAFQEQSEDAPKLFRGLSWNLDDAYDKPKWDAMKAILDQGVGAKFDLPPSSFSEGEEWPTKFMAMKDSGANVRKIKIIPQDARGINIEEPGVKQGEQEWLTGGRFEVVSMGKHGNSFNLVIKQVQGFDKPIQLKQPESPAFISAISEWKGSSVNLSKAITSILQGQPSTNARAQAIVDFLRTNTEDAPPLFRGLKFFNYGEENPAVKAFETANEVGKTVDLPAASFSEDNFAGGSGGGMSKFMYEVTNAKGMDIRQTAGTMLNEKEWISGGRYKVIGQKKDAKGIVHIMVEQLLSLVE